MDKINIKRLAEELNLSISTVSRALRDSHEIGDETKQRVIALAKKLNYQPNPYASSLRRQKTQTIAVIIPEIANNFFSLAINGIEEVAQQKGYHVLIYLTHENSEKEASIVSHLSNGRVDGILISMASEASDIHHLEDLSKKNIPIVFFDRVSEKFNTTKITTDDYKSGHKATEHLLQQGCKKIAFLSVPEHLSIGFKRKQGYMDALKNSIIKQDNDLIVYCNNSYEDNYILIKRLLSKPRRPDGVFASVEKLAITTYHVCRELKLRIPDDIKIISFSNLETASLLNPSLTTITQPAFDMGKEAAIILFKRLEKTQSIPKNENITIESKLIIRESTTDRELGNEIMKD